MKPVTDTALVIYGMFRCFMHVTFGLPDIDYASWDSDHKDVTETP